jgi:formylglycine-generating enzyme required for sulfatase activity
MAWHRGNSGNARHPIATKGWNHWGLYDMHGNVAEWCLDHYTTTLPLSADDPLVLVTDDPHARRVVRGGSFLTWPFDTRSAARDCLPPDTRRHDVGFRVVLDEDPAQPPTSRPTTRQ